MRCISPHENYSIQVIEGKEDIVRDPQGYAQRIVLLDPVVANFDKTGLTEWEQEAALMNFDFSGLPEGVSPLTTVSVFDTEVYVEWNFSAEDRDGAQVKIDARMRELEPRFPGQFMIVEAPKAPRPWPSYDEMSVDEIVRSQEVLRFSPEAIRLYELENANRKGVVEAMLNLEDPSRVVEKPEEEVAASVQA